MRQPAWKPDRLAADLASLDAAETPEERLAAATRLAEIPPDQIEAALDSLQPGKNNRLTLAEKTLLARWASKDGQAAITWAWRNFRPGIKWNEAFSEVCPNWAKQNPAGLSRWTKERLAENPPNTNPAKDQQATLDQPPLDYSLVSRIARWLAASQPLAAYEVVKARGGYSSEDLPLARTLQTVEQVREALLAFPDFIPPESNRYSTEQIAPSALLSRWQELDPEDFSRSRFATYAGFFRESSFSAFLKNPPENRIRAADTLIAGKEGEIRKTTISNLARNWAQEDPDAAAAWISSLPETDSLNKAVASANALFPKDPARALSFIDSLPPSAQATTLATAFDAWQDAHPGRQPDTAAWSAAQRQIWEDLQALRGN